MAGRMLLILISLIVTGQMTLARQSQNKPADQDQSIRLKSELVEMRIVVTDRKGQLVDKLKQEDFEVIADGQPQPISFFSVERIRSRSLDVSPRPGPTAPRTPGASPATPPGRRYPRQLVGRLPGDTGR